jgi:hypothetical protein
MSGSVIPFASMWDSAETAPKITPETVEGVNEDVPHNVSAEDDFVQDTPIVINGGDDIEEEEENTAEDVTIESTPISSLIETLSSEGLFLFDEEKEYNLDETGLRELVVETKEKAKEIGKQEYRASLGNETLLDILENGGTVEDYLSLNEEVDFNQIPMVYANGEPHTENLIQLVTDLLERQGYEQEEIDATVEAYVKSGVIEKQGEIARKKLIGLQAKENEAKIEQIKQAKIAEENRLDEERIKFKEQVLAIREIEGFQVSPEKSKKLYDFITKVGPDGKTEFQKKDNEQKRMLYAFMVMEGMSKETLARTTASEQVGALKKKLNNFTDKQVGARRSSSEDVRNEGKAADLKGIPWMGM